MRGAFMATRGETKPGITRKRGHDETAKASETTSVKRCRSIGESQTATMAERRKTLETWAGRSAGRGANGISILPFPLDPPLPSVVVRFLPPRGFRFRKT
jgi:hypothetical protein